MALVQSEPIPIGWEAKDFSLKDTEGKGYCLKDFADKKGLLIVFTCNHCHYAIASWPLVIEFYHKYKDKIGFAAINPNDEINYPDDSFEQMKVKKQAWKIPFPYLRDDTQKIAEIYQAQCTPDPYLFKNENGTFKLFYHGRVNDNWQNPEAVKEKNLEDAIIALLNNQSSPNSQPPSMGCSIKWVQ